MLRATHGSWMEINNLLRLRALNGTRGLNNITLKTDVSQQYNIGHKGLEEEDVYPLENSEDELMKQPVEIIEKLFGLEEYMFTKKELVEQAKFI